MESIQMAALALVGGWATGLNLYLTAAALGVAHRLHWIVLPGNLEILGNPVVIFFAVLLYLIQFVIDKIPFLDSAWDSVHTFIRPVGGAAIASMAFSDSPESLQYAVAAIAGAASLNAHLGKAGTRVMINTSPEPFSNSAASVAEDGIVLGMLWLIFKHPLIALILVILFAAFIVWLIPKVFRFIKKFFQMLAGKKKDPAVVSIPVTKPIDLD
ncbi:MAG TPA: DUF4126 domain-containing protein [Candidatus Omnitrophota bacterium]|nr:DUF4126 domain-containing protein [Candidatus Omnitrophota bacterium]